jgi:hypothetical protein
MAHAPTFDPFHNRLCRNIRNELSICFINSIHKGDLSPVADAVEKYKSQDPEPFIGSYMDNRFMRYQSVVSDIQSQHIPMEDTYGIACRIWNQSLFFEFHEWLELFWHRAAGTEKKVLQTLIRSAGVYLLLESGRMNGARKMAAKAAAGLSELQAIVPGSFDVARLIDKFSALDPVPPEFGCR